MKCSLTKKAIFSLLLTFTAFSLKNANAIDYNGLWQLETKVLNGECFEEAFNTTSETIKNDPNNSYVAFRILKTLVEKDQKINEIAAIALETIKNNSYFGWQAFEILETLVKKGQCFNEAIDAATWAVNPEHGNNLSDGINLFIALFKKGQGLKEATTALFENAQFLLENGQNFIGALAIALENVKSNDLNKIASKVEALFEKANVCKEIFASALECAKKTKIDTAVLKLAESLLDVGLNFKETFETAFETLKSKNLEAKAEALDSFKELLKNKNIEIKQEDNS